MWPEEPAARWWRGLDLTALQMDEAYLNVTTTATAGQPQLQRSLYLYSLSDDCQRCPYVLTGEVHQQRVFTVGAARQTTWRLYSRVDPTIAADDTRLLECEASSAELGEFGVYDLVHNGSACDLATALPPADTLLSLFLVLALLLALAVVAVLVTLRRFYTTSTETVEVNKPIRKQRIKSLDTFRGLTLALMVFVNDGGGGYWFLGHATWHGLLPADLLFPWFLFIMGVCVPISVRSQLKHGVPRATVFLNILQRSAVLFLLGVMLNTVAYGPELATLRVMGVLQRLAVVYLVVASLSAFLTLRPPPHPHPHLPADHHKPKEHAAHWLADLACLLPQWVVVLAVLAVHSYLTFYVPVPGCPLGYMGAGGIQDGGVYANCTGGAARLLDSLLLGETHLYQTPEVAAVYHTASPFDPEGVLGCLTSVVQAFAGVQAGVTLLTFPSGRARLSRWAVWAVLCALLAYFTTHHLQIPINKNLWTISFVLVTSSTAFFALVVCYLLVDHFVFWNGAPFIYPGMNSIAVYAGHMVCYRMVPWHWRLSAAPPTHLLVALEAVWGTALWVAIAFWLYTKQCFITV